LDKSVSYTVIGEQFGIGRSTVGDIKKNREKNVHSFGCGSGDRIPSLKAVILLP
jgi:hypothetical protein